MKKIKYIIFSCILLLSIACSEMTAEQATSKINEEILKDQINVTKIMELKEKGGKLPEEELSEIVVKELEKINLNKIPNYKKIAAIHQLGIKLKNTDSIISIEKRSKNPDIYKALVYTIFKSDESNLRENLKFISKMKDIQGRTVLYCATYAGFNDVVKVMLEMEESVNQVRENGWTPLMAAVSTENTELVKLFLEKGAKVNVINNNLETPVSLAFMRGKKEIIDMLFENEVEITKKDIEIFVERDKEGLLKYLVEKNYIKPNDLIVEASISPKTIDLLSYLINKGADIEHVSTKEYQDTSFTPLGIAAVHGNLEATKLLIKAGVDVNKTIHTGYRYSSSMVTPLYFAASNGKLEVVKELIKSGADPNIYNDEDEAPLIWASSQGYLLIVKELIRTGADINSGEYTSSLHEAIRNEHPEIVKELIDNGADLNKKSLDLGTPIQLGLESNDWKIRDIFVKIELNKYLPNTKNISINTKDKYRLYNRNGHVMLFQNIITAKKMYTILEQGDIGAVKKIINNSQSVFGYLRSIDNFDTITISERNHYYEGFVTGQVHRDEPNVIEIRLSGSDTTVWTFAEYLDKL